MPPVRGLLLAALRLPGVAQAMAALDERALAANVVGSIQRHFRTQLVDVLNSSSEPPIDYGGGMPFADADLAEWVQLRPMAAVRPPWGLGPFDVAAKRAHEQTWVINVNCFVRSGRQATVLGSFTNLRIWMLRDLVLGACAPGTTILVTDVLGTGETLGNLFVDEVMEDRRVYDPAREELEQHNLVLLARWTETWRP